MKKYRIGMEITEKKLHVAIVVKQRHLWRLMETAAYELNPENLQETLQKVRKQVPRSIRQTILSLAYHHVFMKEIHIDSSLTANEIYLYLQQQSPMLFGKSADHWFLDFEPAISTMNSGQQNSFRAVAAPRQNIAGLLAISHHCGFHIQAIDVDVLALARMVPTLTNYQPDQAQALLWLKTTELMFIAVKAGQLIYLKTAAYSPIQSLKEILPPIIQFFNGLYPQYTLANILLLNECSATNIETASIKIASLSPEIWQTPVTIQPQEFCSLGLAIYDY